MGGFNYDRDVYSSSSSFHLDITMEADGKIIKSETQNPIIIVLDVTGSNINFARLVYDKMPMFYGQIEQQGYLKDFDICFCAVGDAYCDYYPLQVGEFAKGIELDSWLEKIVLEGRGGGQGMESYELAAYYLYKTTKFAVGSSPIIFFIGDEKPYPSLNKSQVERFGITCSEDNIEPFKLLRQKVNNNVFMLLNKYNGDNFEADITTSWQQLLAPEHTILINEEKAVVDLMLGIIAMSSSARTLDSYKIDMLGRGQTQARIAGVSKSLENLSTALVPVKISGTITTTSSSKKSTQKGTRL